MPSFPFLDAHTHAQFAAYDADRKEVIVRALQGGVRMMNVGTERDTSRRAVEVAEEYEDGVYAAVGLHPAHTSESFHDTDELGGGEKAHASVSRGEIFDHDYYRALAMHPKTVAIGECGLDYFHFNESESRELQIQKQKEVFIAQIDLAREVKKPLMIHCRDAFSDLIELLASRRLSAGKSMGDDGSLAASPGVIHFFSGTAEDAKKLLAFGFSFTFGGVITFPPRKGKNTGDYDEIIKMIPLDRILSETDAPYVAPVPYRGKRNEPLYVIEVVKKLAALKNISTEAMADAIAKNAKRIFGI